MGKENTPLSRREFLQASLLGLYGFAKEQRETGPLTDLPVFHTNNTSVRIEPLSRGGQRIDVSLPENQMFTPEWIRLSDTPLDILTPIYPEPGLQVPDAQGTIPWVCDIPHVTGLQPVLMKAVVGYGEQGRGMDRLLGTLEGKFFSDIISTYAFTDRQRIYPSKIYNILTALSLISQWQIDNGPLSPGREYSYLEMSGAAYRNAEQFLTGGYLDAGGICASVTTMSKAVFIASARGYTRELMRFMHEVRLRYGENPYDSGITKENSDATVEWVRGQPDLYHYNKDFKFELLPGCPPLWFSFSANLVLDDEPIYSEAAARHRIQPADARFTFNISLARERPDYETQISRFLNLRSQYETFHIFNDGFLGGRTADGVVIRP